MMGVSSICIFDPAFVFSKRKYMSLQDLKAHMVERVEQTDNVALLEAITDMLDHAVNPLSADVETNYRIASVLERRAKIAAGNCVTPEELHKLMLETAQLGLPERKR